MYSLELDNLILDSSYLEIENSKNYIVEGSYINFVSNKNNNSNEYNNDYLVFEIYCLNNRYIGIDIDGILEYENIDISDYTLVTKEMALEIFLDSDINITKYINKYDYEGLCNTSDNEDDNNNNNNNNNNLNDEDIKIKTAFNLGINYLYIV